MPGPAKIPGSCEGGATPAVAVVGLVVDAVASANVARLEEVDGALAEVARPVEVVRSAEGAEPAAGVDSDAKSWRYDSRTGNHDIALALKCRLDGQPGADCRLPVAKRATQVLW